MGLHANAPLTPEGRRRLVERIDEGRPISHVADLNEYNHDRPHTSIGNRPPISRAPQPGARLTPEPIVIPEDVLTHIPGERRGQLSFDNNVPRVS